MFIKLIVGPLALTVSETSLVLANVLKNHKSYTDLNSVLSHEDMNGIGDKFSAVSSEFVKGTAINSRDITFTKDESGNLTQVEAKFPCAGSAKLKTVTFVPNTLRITDKDGLYNTSSGIASGAAANSTIVFSLSDRHFFMHSSGGTPMVFEFVANDGFYTETSDYIPCVAANASFVSAVPVDPFNVVSYLNGTTGVPINLGTAAREFFWETPYGQNAGDGSPPLNRCYDFVGNNSEKTPLLIPFGAQRKGSGVIGGSISELCDIYFGPADLATSYETVEVGSDFYMVLRLGSDALYIPKW